MRLTEEAKNVFKPFLRSGEELLWSAQPKQGIKFRTQDLFLTPFSILWGGFAIFWEAMVLWMGAPLIMALFGIPFVLIGLHLMIGRFFYDAFLRSKMHYAISNRRALIFYKGKESQIFSWDLNDCKHLSLSRSRENSGTLNFGEMAKGNTNGFQLPYDKANPGPAFEMIENLSEVNEIFERARADCPAKQDLGYGNTFWDENQNQNVDQESQ